MEHISVHGLSKQFSVSVKNEERGWFNNLIRPSKKLITAVDDIHFQVEKGESIAFIGPNGAGKSTTIKMLTGILFPSSGEIRVAGLNPHKERHKLAWKIGTLFGQRSQLLPNLPLSDGFELFGAMYELKPNVIRKRQKELVELFHLEDFQEQPIRKLSLGQRMRAEIAVALLHQPEIIFLDEPTIGLDVVAKKQLRRVLKQLNQSKGVTLFLTSHDAGDIEFLCKRTIVINHGRIVVDEQTDILQRTFFTKKHIHIELADKTATFVSSAMKNIKRDQEMIEGIIDTSAHDLTDALKQILTTHKIADLDVENPSMEEIIETIYARGKKH